MYTDGCELFIGLSDAERSRLLTAAVQRRCPRNTLLIREGASHGTLHLLCSGRAKVYRSDPDGREVIVSMLLPGNFIAELGLLDDEPSPVNVQTVEASEFLVIPRADFHAVLASSPRLSANLIKAMSKRLRDAENQIENLALCDVEARVQKVLWELAEPQGRMWVVPYCMSHRDIAAMVGASREMVTRVFRHLKDKGIVHIDGRRIALHDLTVPPVARIEAAH